MKIGTPKQPLIKPFDIPKMAQPKDMTPLKKPLKVKPHPQQARLEQHRQLPSLVTTHHHLTPNGKGEN